MRRLALALAILGLASGIALAAWAHERAAMAAGCDDTPTPPTPDAPLRPAAECERPGYWRAVRAIGGAIALGSVAGGAIAHRRGRGA